MKSNPILKLKYALLCLPLAAGIASCSNDDALNELKAKHKEPASSLVGQTLPEWEDGYLDIHAINTGRGESTLYILPDGTTVLIDAAGSLLSTSDPIPPTAPKPNGDITSGRVIINYVNHYTKAASSKIDYLMLSHFDTDHMGNYGKDDPNIAIHEGGFYPNGISEVGASIHVDKLIDRGMTYPFDRASETRFKDYIKFIDWAKTAYGMVYETFDVGKNDQVVLKYNPGKYPNFEFRNIFANGYVWTGNGTEIRNTLPSLTEVKEAAPSENIYSCTFVMKYGRFDYFSGGDLQYNDKSKYPWKDVEAPVAAVVSQVDAMKANHHGTSNTNSAALLNKLKANTIIIHPWRDVHPNPETIGRMYDTNSNVKIFSTNMTDPNKVRLSNFLNKLNSMDGHIVIRVKPDELFTYTVYVLDDTNEDYKIKKTFGPYFSF